MRILDRVLGHEAVTERLLNAYEQEHLGAVHLFVGPSGIGKRQLALGLAQAMVCERSSRACGLCAPCLRLEHGQSESLRVITPEGNQIRVEQAHGILEFLSLKHLGKSSVVLVDQVHLLNPTAANTLLKLLEEPPSETYFFLITTTLAAVLPTIRSRAQVVRFRPLTAELMRLRAKEAPAWALRSSQGSFERLFQMTEEAEGENRARAAQVFHLLVQDPDFLMNENWREDLRDRGSVKSFYHYWQGFVRDALAKKVGSWEQVQSQDQEALLNRLAEFSEEDLLNMWNRLQVMENGLLSNQDPQLNVEAFWIENIHGVRVLE